MLETVFAMIPASAAIPHRQEVGTSTPALAGKAALVPPTSTHRSTVESIASPTTIHAESTASRTTSHGEFAAAARPAVPAPSPAVVAATGKSAAAIESAVHPPIGPPATMTAGLLSPTASTVAAFTATFSTVPAAIGTAAFGTAAIGTRAFAARPVSRPHPIHELAMCLEELLFRDTAVAVSVHAFEDFFGFGAASGRSRLGTGGARSRGRNRRNGRCQEASHLV